MVEIEKAQTFGPNQDRLRFNIRIIDEDSRREKLFVMGCKVVGGQLYGPSFKMSNGEYCTCVSFSGDLLDAIVDALVLWHGEEDFERVKWPKKAKRIL